MVRYVRNGCIGGMMETALGAFVAREMRARGMDQRALSIASNVPKATISRIIGGQVQQPERDTLARLAATLDVSLSHLLELAGYALDAAVNADPELRELWTAVQHARAHPEQRALLLRMLDITRDPEMRARISGYLDALQG